MNSTTTLYLGTAEQGMSMDVLLPLRVYARHYKASVVHLGPLATEDEIRMYAKRTRRLATWRKQLDELAGSTSLTPQDEAALVQAGYDELVERGRDSPYLVDWDQLSEDELTSKDITRLTRMLIAKINEERVRRELRLLTDAQLQRVRTLTSVFEGIRFAFAENQCVAFESLKAVLGERYLGTEVRGRYIDALSMPANGPKVSHAPITPRTISILARSGKSAIMPHAIPMTESRASEGLNNARNYFTTGSLRLPEEPTSTLDLHKGKHLPGAVVCVYAEDGAFFANNLIVEHRNGVAPFIAEDGLVFSAKGVAEAGGKNSAIVLNDLHAPYEHPGVVNGAIYAGRALKADTVILNGDIIDHEADNRHAAGRPGLVEGKRTRADLEAGKRLTDRIAEEIGAANLWWILGNHEMWMTQLTERHPSLIGLLDWDSLAKEWFARWKFIMRKAGGNNLCSFGSLTPRHGDEESLKAAIEALGDVINAHWHRYYRIGQSGIVGAGCRLAPAYVGNNLTAWQSQFATLTKHHELTQTSYKTCLHSEEKNQSRFAFRNKIVTVSWQTGDKEADNV